MPKPSSDLISTQQLRRLFIQFGGPAPGNVVKYAGQDAQYMILEGVTKPLLGGIEPVRVPDPNRQREFKVVGRKASAPDLPTATLRALEKHKVLPFQLGDLQCPFNLYMPVGSQCEDLSNFLTGWDDFVEIYSYAEATSVDMGDRSAWEDDNQIADGIPVTLDKIYAIGALAFSAKAASEIDREVVDIVYGSKVGCGSCGPSDDGTARIYGVTKSSGGGSPGLPAEVIYTTDGGLTLHQVNIDGFGASEDPVAIDIVGDKLVVVGDGAYFWATIDKDTGVPGTFTEVTTGFVANHDPLDIFVLSARETFFSAEGGYIYRSTDITAGVSVMDAGVATSSNLLRIHGDGNEVIVAVGAADTVVISEDRGQSWAASSDAPFNLAVDIGAVAVKSTFEIHVGSLNSGRYAYTLDGGKSWTALSFQGTGTGSVRDIVVATDEVMWFVHDDGTPTAHIFATWNGGANWVREDGGSKRILNWPVFDRVNRLAVPQAGPGTTSNHLAVAGLAGDGTDGIFLIGEAAEQ